MESLYDVCFAGELLDGQSLSSVRPNIQKLFNANPETLDKLFSGKTQILKRGCDKSTALKYRAAMERAGAQAIVRTHAQSPEPETAPAPNQAADNNLKSAPTEQGLSLAAVGSDVLRADERTSVVAAEIDLSGLNLAAAGSTLGESIEATVCAPDTSHLSMGEVGEDIPNLPDTRTPLTPNTGDISLSPEGSDFADCAPPAAEAPELDLSNIETAPVGSDVLEEKYKKVVDSNAPDTSHITLQE